MEEKIFALLFDVDGSVMPQGGPIDPKISEFFQYLKREGLLIGPASGKNIDYCRGLACGIGVSWDFISAEGGANFSLLINKNPLIYKFCQNEELNEGMLDLLEFLLIIKFNKLNYTFRINSKEEKVRQELKESIVTFFPYDSDIKSSAHWGEYFKEVIEKYNLKLQVFYHESDGYYDIVPENVSKVFAIDSILKCFHFKEENILTVVDGSNDHGLVKKGVKTIAVANAIPSIKEAVKENFGYISKKENGDGFIDGLKYYADKNFFCPSLNKMIEKF